MMCAGIAQDVGVGVGPTPISCTTEVEGMHGESLWRLKPWVRRVKVIEMSFTSWDSWWKDQSL